MDNDVIVSEWDEITVTYNSPCGISEGSIEIEDHLLADIDPPGIAEGLILCNNSQNSDFIIDDVYRATHIVTGKDLCDDNPLVSSNSEVYLIGGDGYNLESAPEGTITMKDGFKAEYGSMFNARILNDFTSSIITDYCHRPLLDNDVILLTNPPENKFKNEDSAGSRFDGDENYIDKNSLSIYPNPFKQEFNLDYEISNEFDLSEVTLAIHSITGSRMSLLFENKIHTSGFYSIPFQASALQAGMYFCILKIGDQIINKRIVKIN